MKRLRRFAREQSVGRESVTQRRVRVRDPARACCSSKSQPSRSQPADNLPSYRGARERKTANRSAVAHCARLVSSLALRDNSHPLRLSGSNRQQRPQPSHCCCNRKCIRRPSRAKRWWPTANASCSRRTVSFCSAVYSGSQKLTRHPAIFCAFCGALL